MIYSQRLCLGIRPPGELSSTRSLLTAADGFGKLRKANAEELQTIPMHTGVPVAMVTVRIS